MERDAPVAVPLVHVEAHLQQTRHDQRRPTLAGRVQQRAVVVVAHGEVGTRVGEEHEEAVEPLLGAHHDQKLRVLRRRGGQPGSFIQKQVHQAAETPPRRQAERGGAETVQGVHVGAGVDEEPRHLDLSRLPGHQEEGRSTVSVSQLRVGTVLEQEAGDGQPIPPNR